MKLFAIGAYAYLNIDYIKEVWTDEHQVTTIDGTDYHFAPDVFEELLEIIKPTMCGSQCEFNKQENESNHKRSVS